MTDRLREDEQSRTYGSSFAEILDGLFTDEDATALLKVVADPTRFRILSALNTEELCVCDLAAVVGISESAVSHQL